MRLRVCWVDGLLVVAPPGLPGPASGKSQAPTMAVAWIAADLLLAGS
ncbi:MAG TPA: hypothetical protein VGJ59_17135 [Jatrophihabitantaceae bacterium]|jgi:hypothetical protein